MSYTNFNELKNYNRSTIRYDTSCRSRLSDPNTNCILNFNNALPQLNNVVAISINMVSFMNNFYNVASYNNRMIFEIYDPSNAIPITDYEVVVPVGYYNAVQLATVLQTLIRALNPILSSLTVTYLSSVKRFQFDVNNATTAISIFISPSSNSYVSSLLYLLGIDLTGLPLANPILTTTKLPNLNGATIIYINSSKLTNNKTIKNDILTENILRSTSSKSISELISIPINTVYGAYQEWADNGSKKGQIFYSTPQNIDTIDIKITDAFGNILETDSDSPIVITFQTQYE